MDQATLVINSMDIMAGSQVVRTLDQSGVPIDVGLWMATPEFEEGRVVLASSALDQPDLLRSYDRVAEILVGEFQTLPSITILRMEDPLIRDLRQIFAGAKSVAGMRLGAQTIGNRFISEAYIYKVQ